MANKINVIVALAFVAVTFAGSALAEDAFHEQELKLMKQLFDDAAPALKPLKAQELLHQLEELYAGQKDFETIGDGEKSRRMVVFTVSERGEVKEENCVDSYFGESQRLMNLTSDIPNIKSYLDYFFQEQLKLCKSKDPNFKYTPVA